MRLAQNPNSIQFGEADLESELLGESDARCSYPPPGPESEVSMLRTRETTNEEPPAPSDSRITLRAPAPSSALLELSGIELVLAEREEPLRETREPFRQYVRDTWPDSLRTAPPPADIEQALRRAARTSFASDAPQASRRISGVRLSAPHSIEEAVLRVVDAADTLSDPLREPLPFKLPEA
jgi:hypothetical protein